MVLKRNNKSRSAVEFPELDGMERSLARVVLVVDDEPLVLEVTESMLKDLGCEVVTAPGANEALEKLSTDQRIEVLITDINMPGMDGHELARAAVRMRKRLKVIVLSGREAEGCGFPLLRKPFLLQDLVETMRRTTGLC
jgi:two-component system, cell cycle response regulator CpdR